MAITLTKSVTRSDQPVMQVPGMKVQLLRITYSGTYATGGDALTAADFGVSSLTAIQAVFVDAVGESLGANKTCLAQWNTATSKVVVYGEDGTGASAGLPLVEMANGATLTGLVVNLLVFSG